MAGGLSVDPDRITELVADLDTRLAPELAAAADAMALKADGVLSASGLTLDLARTLEQAGPYGQGNAEPCFVLPRMRVSFAKRVGTDHVRFTLTDIDSRRGRWYLLSLRRYANWRGPAGGGPGLVPRFRTP